MAASSSVLPEEQQGQQQHLVVNLCSASAGAKILFATDEWFAAADNLLNDAPPIFIPDLYCEQGKVMDGWETRRRREAGHDWCIIQLGYHDHEIHNMTHMEVDTAYFTGNHVPNISILAANLTWTQEKQLITTLPGAFERLLQNYHQGSSGSSSSSSSGHGDNNHLWQGTGHNLEQVELAERIISQDLEVEWFVLLPPTPLNPGYETSRWHSFPLDNTSTMRHVTHVRLNYFPDGGVARLRIWGTIRNTPMEMTVAAATTHATTTTTTKTTTTSSSCLTRMDRLNYIPVTKNDSDCSVVFHSMVTSKEELPSRRSTKDDDLVEISSSTMGGKGICCSNQHYGAPWKLLQVGLGQNMGDGWETARHPNRPSIWIKHPQTNLMDSPLMDWAILQLGKTAITTTTTTTMTTAVLQTNLHPNVSIERIILDTNHFRGNYPESVQVDGCYYCCINENDYVLDQYNSINNNTTPSSLSSTSKEWWANQSDLISWFPLIPRTRMFPDAEHVFHGPQIHNGEKPITHVRVCIFPDGGLSRVRIYAKERNKIITTT